LEALIRAGGTSEGGEGRGGGGGGRDYGDMGKFDQLWGDVDVTEAAYIKIERQFLGSRQENSSLRNQQVRPRELER
jgi:hypothetical protein